MSKIEALRTVSKNQDEQVKGYLISEITSTTEEIISRRVNQFIEGIFYYLGQNPGWIRWQKMCLGPSETSPKHLRLSIMFDTNGPNQFAINSCAIGDYLQQMVWKTDQRIHFVWASGNELTMEFPAQSPAKTELKP